MFTQCQTLKSLPPSFLSDGARVILDIHDIVPEFLCQQFKVGKRSLIFRLLVYVERLSIAYSSHVIISNHLWYKNNYQALSQFGKVHHNYQLS